MTRPNYRVDSAHSDLDGELAFRRELLAAMAEQTQILRRIETSVSGLLRRDAGGELDESFGKPPKINRTEQAELEKRFGKAFDRLTDGEAEDLAAGLSPNARAAFARAGKPAVKFQLMRLMAKGENLDIPF